MAMRMTENQRELAWNVGYKSFPGLYYDLNTLTIVFRNYPMTVEEMEAQKAVMPVNWEAHFKRNDITEENKEVFTQLLLEGYAEAYQEWVLSPPAPEVDIDKLAQFLIDLMDPKEYKL